MDRRKDAVKLGCMGKTGAELKRGSLVLLSRRGRGGRTWGCIREDPKECFGDDIFRRVCRSLFEIWVLRAWVLFDVAAGEERPAPRVWWTSCRGGL